MKYLFFQMRGRKLQRMKNCMSWLSDSMPVPFGVVEEGGGIDGDVRALQGHSPSNNFGVEL